MRMAYAGMIAILALAGPGAARGQSGVLIGFLDSPAQSESAQTFEELKEPTYQTLWVAPDKAGKLAIVAAIPELIVPRKDGFWHVGVKQVCEFSKNPMDRDGGNESVTQTVWKARIADAGTVSAKETCKPHDPGDYAPPFGRSEADQNKISQCGFELTEIEYASPAILSIRNYSGQSEDCEPRGGRYAVDFSVVGYDSEEQLTVENLLGPEAHQAYIKALPEQGQGDAGDDCGEPSQSDSGWRVGWLGGRWGFYAHQNLGYFGCMVDAPVKFRLPASITGDVAAQPDWKQLKARIPDMEYAFLSPAKDLLVVVTKAEVSFCEAAEGAPGKVLLSLPLKPIVMLQWSTGTHVEAWSKQLAALAAHPLPQPQVRLVAAKN